MKFLFCRTPVFKSLEELDLPKHSKVKRQSSTPKASELEQQPDININDWKNKSTYEILQKLDVRSLGKNTVQLHSHEMRYYLLVLFLSDPYRSTRLVLWFSANNTASNIKCVMCLFILIRTFWLVVL